MPNHPPVAFPPVVQQRMGALAGKMRRLADHLDAPADSATGGSAQERLARFDREWQRIREGADELRYIHMHATGKEVR